MNDSEMTDFEIDVAVAEIILPGRKITNFAGEAVVWFGNLETRIVRYCKSWADAGPIIEKENISLTCHQSRDEWAAIFNRHCMSANQNPLRAAMECFLMKKERENAA